MFRSIWSKSLRDYRVPVLGWGLGLALLMFVGFATATPAVLVAFTSFAKLLRFLGDAYAMQTPEGYITFRYLSTVVPLLLSFWAILAGARMLRGEEERGTLDVLLATPQPRARLLLEKMAAFITALILIAVLIGLGAVAGEASLGGHIDLVRALIMGLNVSLLTFFFSMLALLLSQFTASRSAAVGWTSGLLLLALLLVIVGREVNGSWVQHLSPFYYYDLNRPLIPSFTDQPLAALLLLGLSVLWVMLSFVLFARRDIGRAAFSWRQKQASSKMETLRSLSRAERTISTRTVATHTLYAQGWSSICWLFGIVAICTFCVILVPNIQEAFYKLVQETPFLQKLFFDTPANSNTALLGTILFTFLPALVILFALILALKWSSDLENGRLELILGTPNSRPRILLERFGANAFVVLLAPVLTWPVLLIGARMINLNIDQGRILAASFSMLPPALIAMGLVYALAGRLRYGVVLGILTAYLALAYVEEALEGAILFPGWLMSLSIFHVYGNPIFLGMNWTNFLGMAGVAIVLLIIGLVQFRYADVALG
jgi:ABC-2 type transport system permease protein